jgi:hypothetical protein
VTCNDTHRNRSLNTGFQVLTAVVMKNSIVWDRTLCSLLRANRRFGGICRFYLQERRINQTKNPAWIGSNHRSICLSIFLWLYSPLLGLGRSFSFLISYTVVRTLWTGYEPVARPLPERRTPQTQNKRIQTSMLRVGFEHTILVFERAKTVDALDRAATVIGRNQRCIMWIRISGSHTNQLIMSSNWDHRVCPSFEILREFLV